MDQSMELLEGEGCQELSNIDKDPLHNIKEQIYTMNGNFTDALKASLGSPECSGSNGSLMSRRTLLVQSLNQFQNIGKDYNSIVSMLMKQNMVNTLKNPNTGGIHSNKSSENRTHTIELMKNGLCDKFTPDKIMTLGMLWLDEYQYQFE